jgi:hypothetical protein
MDLPQRISLVLLELRQYNALQPNGLFVLREGICARFITRPDILLRIEFLRKKLAYLRSDLARRKRLENPEYREHCSKLDKQRKDRKRIAETQVEYETRRVRERENEAQRREHYRTDPVLRKRRRIQRRVMNEAYKQRCLDRELPPEQIEFA